VVKSLIVEVDKRVKARIVNAVDKRVKESCTDFLKNLKGTIFYGVPHTGGGEDLKPYFIHQSQRFNDENGERFANSGILRNIEQFNRQMVALSVDFGTSVGSALNIFAFAEGQPLRRGVSVSSKSLSYNNDYQGRSV
jgi:hypothetical protein